MIGIRCGKLEDLPALRDFAEMHSLGLELQEFAQPEILDGEWRGLLHRYRQALAEFSGPISLHGPFVDLFSGSVDPRIAAVAMDRYRQSLEIAAELGAWLVNFHLNYNPLVDESSYRPRWLERQVGFWATLALEAQAMGIRIALENMWEPDPFLQVEVIQKVSHFHVGACLDNGAIPMEPVLSRLVRCLNRPMLILEMPSLAEIQESFPVLQRILQRMSWPQ
ncbi:TIM barrel protein [Thermoflexus sp.]|uniref:TIM barrel protein n=1 Tax=Thermoflexus sp. TaxID=1969742 RepID=UPI0035E43BE9